MRAPIRHVFLLTFALTACEAEPTPPTTVAEWVEIFKQALIGWEVVAGTQSDPETDCTVTVYPSARYAIVHPCSTPDQASYTLEEVAHVAIIAACEDREADPPSIARVEQVTDVIQRLALEGL